jgi:hypothetical protein
MSASPIAGSGSDRGRRTGPGWSCASSGEAADRRAVRCPTEAAAGRRVGIAIFAEVGRYGARAATNGLTTDARVQAVRLPVIDWKVEDVVPCSGAVRSMRHRDCRGRTGGCPAVVFLVIVRGEDKEQIERRLQPPLHQWLGHGRLRPCRLARTRRADAEAALKRPRTDCLSPRRILAGQLSRWMTISGPRLHVHRAGHPGRPW